jgi:hypothetical protein
LALGADADALGLLNCNLPVGLINPAVMNGFGFRMERLRTLLRDIWKRFL